MDGLVDIHRESALIGGFTLLPHEEPGNHSTKLVACLPADPPGDLFIQGFDTHIMDAFPKLE
ncbi:hypothetical protein RSAG8_13536, partial [Rhizoctonia solani AG-8 WAC10335]